MKCAYHPEVDAVGVCMQCGRMLCQDCSLRLQGRMYCQQCADSLFAGQPSGRATTNRSGLLTAGGILSIVGGAFGILYALFFVFPFVALLIEGSSGDDDEGAYWFPLIFMAPFVLIFGVLGVLGIVGGIQALKRQRFGLALAGAICCAIPSSVFGVIAVVFIAMSKDEFKKKQSAPL